MEIDEGTVVAILAVLIQIREGKDGTPDQERIQEARDFLNHVRGVRRDS